VTANSFFAKQPRIHDDYKSNKKSLRNAPKKLLTKRYLKYTDFDTFFEKKPKVILTLFKL
jgi:hypothetical protein